MEKQGVKFVHVPDWAMTMFRWGEGLVPVEDVVLSDTWKEAF